MKSVYNNMKIRALNHELVQFISRALHAYEARVVEIKQTVKRIVIIFHRIHSGFVLCRWEYNPECSRFNGPIHM